jgi:hypothetical protein
VTGKNATPLVGWHPSAGLVAWLDAEVQRRGGGRGVRSEILEEALAAYRDGTEAFRESVIRSAAAVEGAS